MRRIASGDGPNPNTCIPWAVLTDPDDTAGSCKGYIKCDISIITKVSTSKVLISLFNMFQTNQGDAVKIPNKTDNDDDDIES